MIRHRSTIAEGFAVALLLCTRLRMIGRMKSVAEKLRSEQCARIRVALADGSKSAEELAKITRLTIGSIALHVGVMIDARQVRRVAGKKFALRH